MTSDMLNTSLSPPTQIVTDDYSDENHQVKVELDEVKLPPISEQAAEAKKKPQLVTDDHSDENRQVEIELDKVKLPPISEQAVEDQKKDEEPPLNSVVLTEVKEEVFEPTNNGNAMATSPPALQIALPDANEPENSVNSSFDGDATNGRAISSYNGDSMSPPLEDGSVYCHLCSYIATSQAALYQHLESHQEHRCDKCDFTSRTEGRLKQHIMKFHSVGGPPFGDGSLMDLGPSPETLMAMANGELAIPEGYPQATQRTAGRRKVHRCKQCEFVTSVKTEFWKHSRKHIKEEKLLQCPKCEFVTEYKHHLEYHLRNHFGSKPFKCSKCNYACVNKSMLNSHMKSHTNIYQYRCSDCNYATKYCHSLKLHLRKYNHQPASILNLDGTVDHDTSALLTMKKSGPKGGKVKDEKRVSVHHGSPASASTAPLHSHLVAPHRLPLPPPTSAPNIMPFWGAPFAGDMRPAPPPLISAGMGGLLAGLMPPTMKPHTITSQEQCRNNPFYLELQKCEQCDYIAKSKEELNHHVITCHSVPAKFLNMLGGMTPNRTGNMLLPNSLPWHNDMLNMGRAPAPIYPLAHFGSPNNMGYINNYKPPQPRQPVTDSAISRVSRSSVCSTRTVQTDNSSGANAMEIPLDLTKSNVTNNQSTDNQQPSRKRSRKGKAYKLDALCLKLQAKFDHDDKDSDDEPKVKRRANDQLSSHSDPLMSQYPSPTESADGGLSDYSCDKTYLNNNNCTTSKQLDPEPNNNNILSPRFKASNNEVGNETLDTQMRQTNSNGIVNLSNLSERVARLPEGRNERFTCSHCDISFGNRAMHTMHMGYHGYQNPFICNMCGLETSDQITFFCHIATSSHRSIKFKTD